jgi:hypothetical protein
MTATGSPVSCPRCHAAPGEACTLSPFTLHKLDGAGIVHAARTVLAGYAHALETLNRRDRHAVDVWVNDGARWHPDGRVSLAATAPGAPVRPFYWHVYRGDVLDSRGRVLGAARSIAEARQLVAAAMLDTVPAGGTL